MPRDRGPYTCVYSALIDSPEYDALSASAAAVWWALKHSPENGITGIMRIFPDQIARRSKVKKTWVTGSLRELEQSEWIRTESDWLWIRNHLRFNPGFQPTNDKHVAGLTSAMAGLPKINLVCDFVEYYKALGYLPANLEWETRKSIPIAITVAVTEAVTTTSTTTSRARARSVMAANSPSVDRDETRALINAYNDVLKAHISFTPGNLKAADRMYGSGYTLEQAKTVFAAVSASQTPTAAWCHDHNREYEYLIRPQYRSTRSQELVPAVIDKVLNELGSGRLVERRA
jgi:hypothetical protein